MKRKRTKKALALQKIHPPLHHSMKCPLLSTISAKHFASEGNILFNSVIVPLQVCIPIRSGSQSTVANLQVAQVRYKEIVVLLLRKYSNL
jgi:hypothetical protein